MKPKNMSPEETHQHVTRELANAIISIAHANSDFVCTECLRTLERLKSVLGCLDGEVAAETIAEVNAIME